MNHPLDDPRRVCILTCARELLVNKGVVFTVSDLAKESNISVGSVYKYFKSKEEILATLLDEDIQEGHQPQDALALLLRYIPVELSDVIKRKVL